MISLQGRVDNYIILDNERYSYFAGNNYLGLAGHPDVIAAAINALQRYGASFSASRLTTGSSEIHKELEKLLSEFKGKQDAVVFASGYMGNSLLLKILQERYEIILADSFSHTSITDAVPRNKQLILYNHCDPVSLEEHLINNPDKPALIITDGIFALTGEIAPLDKLYAISKKYNAQLVVDDAHATGVLGAEGRGTPEYFNLQDVKDIFQTDTLSKALGSYGGYISGGTSLINQIRTESTFYGASTSLPPPVVAAACESVRIVMNHPELRAGLKKNADWVRSGVKELGFITNSDPTPVIPVFFDKSESAEGISHYLLKNHIIAPFVDYPVKTGKFVLRITVSSNHDAGQIENLLIFLKKWRDKNGTGNY
ncbi:MAG: pyridoxal phosphate-dependent aminotransferase family protein [Bacteroidales bacterium]|jgi:7-keto-8-aminopelargonate synthetase-like enzyme|nr:pyridoxal phosphate-dependent aminotransferase family protein [Bacteroidales bacterium]